jgi:putative addiction module CopG family antidote
MEVTLPSELERFATEAVASGRYRDTSDVVRAALSLLQDSEAEIAAFRKSLEDALAEGERDGFFEIEDVHREMIEQIEEIESRRR